MEQVAASSVPLSGSSSGTDEALLRWNHNRMLESVQGQQFGGPVVDAKIVINGRFCHPTQGLERENFQYSGQTKNWKKESAR